MSFNKVNIGGKFFPPEWFDFDREEKTMETDDKIRCPDCKSTKWRCYDESCRWFIDKAGHEWSLPVGSLVCEDCGRAWEDAPWYEDDGVTPLEEL